MSTNGSLKCFMMNWRRIERGNIMESKEFIRFMEDHDITINDISRLYHQWRTYNYITKMDIMRQLNDEPKKYDVFCSECGFSEEVIGLPYSRCPKCDDINIEYSRNKQCL